MTTTLHIHLDESGNWAFNKKGTKYLVLTAAWTYDPQPLAHSLTALRFGLLRGGQDIESFHAAPQLQAIRDLVVGTLIGQDNWAFGAVLVEKAKVNPSIYEPARFYPIFAGILMRFILRGRGANRASRALIYADTLPMDTNAKRQGVLKTIHGAMKAELPGKPYHIFSHCHQSNCWIQAVDYCCWAIQRKWEQGDSRTYDQLKRRLAKEELNVTARGDGTSYY